MAKPATLDKTRSYGVSKGLSDSGTCFTQDHKNFDHNGTEIMPPNAEPEGDYEDWKAPRLRAAIKERAGKGPRPGTTKVAMVETLRALDAAEAVDDED